jgi:hypothetical protein
MRLLFILFLLTQLTVHISAQTLNFSFSVNKTGTGLYQIECKAEPGQYLAIHDGEAGLFEKSVPSTVWRKSWVNDSFFYLDCMEKPKNAQRFRATSYLGVNLTTSGLDGMNNDTQWRLKPSNEKGWFYIVHRTSGRLLQYDGQKLWISNDLHPRDAVKWKMTLQKLDLSQIECPRIMMGDDYHALRNPCVVYVNDMFYMYHTVVFTGENEEILYTVGVSKSEDLVRWTPTKILTEKDQNISCSSPGSITRFDGKWILSLQTYPMPGNKRSGKLRFANESRRNWIMRSDDLENWSERELLKVMGPDVDPGTMIDPFILEDKDEPGKWWCFFKRDGASYSYSYDLKNWTYAGRTEAGENIYAWVENDEYYIMHSPERGMGIKRSRDMKNWEEVVNPEDLVLDQDNWEWGSQRVTAGHIVDLRDDPRVGKYLLFFHGQGPSPKTTEIIHSGTDMGIAWSDDLITWDWPGKKNTN